jgi:hypothetical protein
MHIFMIGNTSYCEAIESDSDTTDQDEEKKKKGHKFQWLFDILFELILLFMFAWIIDDCFSCNDGDSDNDSDGYSSDSSEPEIKPTPEPYVQGPAHHFFVRNIGIRYEDEVALDTPKLDVNNAADRQYMNEAREALANIKELNKNKGIRK